MFRLTPPVVLTILVACAVSAGAAPRSGPGLKTFIIVRHAEAEPESAGPQRPLSGVGRERALELARVLGDTPLTAVYSSLLPRSRLTAEPVARTAGVPLLPLEDTQKTLEALAAARWGTTVVVVGHSNT